MKDALSLRVIVQLFLLLLHLFLALSLVLYPPLMVELSHALAAIKTFSLKDARSIHVDLHQDMEVESMLEVLIPHLLKRHSFSNVTAHTKMVEVFTSNQAIVFH